MQVLVLLASLGVALAAEICCPNIGCFRDTGVFSGLPLPECPATQGITLEVFTRSNRNSGQSVTRTNIPSVWSGSKHTVFLIHGWNGNKDSGWMNDAKNAILDKDDKNVVIIGWGIGAGRANYLQSASNTRCVGAEARQIKEAMRSAHGSNIYTYCAGHSLGGHTCGHFGQFSSDKGLNRITALDPAGPAFQGADDRRGLNINCATRVEAWHTDGKDSANSYGTLKVMGHKDYYPAAAGIQPGCTTKLGFIDVVENPELKDDPLVACSHSRAPKYFVQSVKSDCFKVRQICTNENNLPGSCSTCSNCASMGYVENSGPDGKFYLDINSAEPHCQN